MEDLYIPVAESKRVKEDFKMWAILELLLKHKQILELTASGCTTVEVGKIIYLSSRTVEFHIYEMMKATSTKNKTALVAVAFRLKIIK